MSKIEFLRRGAHDLLSELSPLHLWAIVCHVRATNGDRM